MSISITNDVYSVTELKRNTRALLNKAHQMKRPIILTVNGKADAVLIDAKVFEERLQINTLNELIGKAQTAKKAGKILSFDNFMKKFKDEKEV